MTDPDAWARITEHSAALTRLAAGAVADAVTRPDCAQARMLGSTGSQVRAAFLDLERETQRSVWALSTHPGDPRHLVEQAEQRSLNRGLDLRTIMDTAAGERPIAAPEAIHREQIRLAPVQLQMILLDRERVVVDGPTVEGTATSGWLVWEPATVASAVALWEVTAQLSVPLPATAIFLSDRQREVARGLLEGLTDAAIARSAGVSVRTVASEVRLLMDAVGARSRYQTAVRLLRL